LLVLININYLSFNIVIIVSSLVIENFNFEYLQQQFHFHGAHRNIELIEDQYNQFSKNFSAFYGS